MKAIQSFEAWQDSDGETTFATASSITERRSKQLLSASAIHLYSVEANSWEEAMAIHHLRMGYAPYKPCGVPEPGLDCGALVYVDGSGQCWQCGRFSGAA